VEQLSIREVVEAVGGRLLKGSPGSVVTGVNTDTRSIERGDLFFALKGEHADGHVYVGRALEAGASGVVISDQSFVPAESSAAVVLVDDPLWALGELARHYRRRFDVRVVGITGSVGKTTTKEMLASILERKWRVLKNPVNFNNEIGVPLTLFELDRGHEAVVIEMAMRGLGEISRLAVIAGPQVGVITNVGISHIERLGSQGAIAEAKAELLAELPPDGLAVLNAEDGYFRLMCERFPGRVISFGSCESADVVATKTRFLSDGRCSFVLTWNGDSVEVNVPILGHHNVYNALAASAAAVGMGVDLGTIREGIEGFSSLAMRMELVKSDRGYAVLNDAYNAGPASMLAALRTLRALKGYKRRIAVLGDMLELGDYASKAHSDLGVAIVDNGVGMLVTVGCLAKEIANGAKAAGFPADAIRSYADSSEAGRKLRDEIVPGDVVLVKGSRAVKMEEIVRTLADD
jgi:UDP-N-acetylmuramoyl-tripeptide--D-alanyl-D-alanine ligase